MHEILKSQKYYRIQIPLCPVENGSLRLCFYQFWNTVMLSTVYASASLLPPSLHCSVYHCAFITPASYSTHHCILCERVEKAPLSVR